MPGFFILINSYMSDAFTNFLGGVVGGTFGSPGNLRDYEHANRLYVQNTYARAPKVGFLYFVVFNINSNAIQNAQWKNRNQYGEVGLLVKKIDMPRFTIANEVINQYNKKNVVQTGIKYNPVAIEFHDDNSDLTTGLWTNYYKYYYVDSKYGDQGLTQATQQNSQTAAFKNSGTGTKYDKNYRYGLNAGQTDPFFNSIDIFVLHQHRFTKMTLVNPLVTEWSHDNLDQTEPNKILSNKMTVAYESVLYNTGKIKKGSDGGQFIAHYYDQTPSPLSVGGKGNSTIFGEGGLISGVDSVFGSIADGNYLGAAIQAATTIRNAKNITKAGLIAEGTGLANSALAGIATSNGGFNSANIGSAALNSVNQTGQLGVILPNGQFSASNLTQATQKSVTGK
jgi:hypothetical protein